MLVTDPLVLGQLCCGVKHLPHEEDVLGAGGIDHCKEWLVEYKDTFLGLREKHDRDSSGCCSLRANFIHLQDSLMENLREKTQASQPLQMHSSDSCHS